MAIEQDSHKGSVSIHPDIKKTNFDKIFITIFFLGLLVEAASSIFNLVSNHVFIENHIKHKVVTLFYIICAIVSLTMIISSSLAIKQAHDNNKITAKDIFDDATKLDDQEESHVPHQSKVLKSKVLSYLNKHEKKIVIAEDVLNITSHVLWIIVYLSLITMLFTVNYAKLQQANLLLSIIAPLLSVISCILRLTSTVISYNRPNNDKATKQSHKALIVLLNFILFFEVLHCTCHIIETVTLQGKLQDLYSFQNNIVLFLEAITILAFIVTFFINTYLDHKKTQQQNHDVTDDPKPSDNPYAPQSLLYNTTDDTVPLMSNLITS